MSQPSAPPTGEQETSGEQHTHGGWEDILGYLNSATLRGLLAISLGVFVLLVPDITLSIVEAIVVIAAVGSGLIDLWFFLTGREGKRTPNSRIVALLRGLLSLAFALAVFVVPRTALGLLVSLVGLYLAVRGLIAIISSLATRKNANWEIRLAGGVLSFAFGVLAWLSPETIAEGLIVTAALAGLLLGAIVLTFGLRAPSHQGEPPGPNASVTEIIWDWVRRVDVQNERREELAEGLYYEEPALVAKLAAWFIMLALSVAIATFAIMQDSTAVVIGAMLIAPLMIPILGLAGALVNGWSGRAWRSSVLIIAGVSLAVVLSYVLAAWTPAVIAYESNTQITSRVNPSLPDMLIAIAAGAAGAFATVNSRVASSLPGVAIAVALVPPLSVVGVSLYGGRFADAAGAMLLFLTNFVSIVLAAALVFALGGFARHDLLRARAKAITLTLVPFAALAALILVPLVFTSEGVIATSAAERDAQGVVDDWLGEDSRLEVTAVTIADGVVDVRLIGSQRPPELEPLQDALIEELGRPLGVALFVTPVSAETLPPPVS